MLPHFPPHSLFFFFFFFLLLFAGAIDAPPHHDHRHQDAAPATCRFYMTLENNFSTLDASALGVVSGHTLCIAGSNLAAGSASMADFLAATEAQVAQTLGAFL